MAILQIRDLRHIDYQPGLAGQHLQQNHGALAITQLPLEHSFQALEHPSLNADSLSGREYGALQSGAVVLKPRLDGFNN